MMRGDNEKNKQKERKFLHMLTNKGLSQKELKEQNNQSSKGGIL